MHDTLLWKLWDTANVITGFAAVQSIGFIFASLSANAGEKIAAKSSFPIILAVLVFSCAIYVAGAIWCNKIVQKYLTVLVKSEKKQKRDLKFLSSSWKKMTLGRVITIIFFSMLPISFILYCRVCL